MMISAFAPTGQAPLPRSPLSKSSRLRRPSSLHEYSKRFPRATTISSSKPAVLPKRLSRPAPSPTARAVAAARPAVGVIALESIVSRLEVSEQRLRAEQAVQVDLFAEALDQASPDHYTTLRNGRTMPDRERAEMAYRTIRAEIACALHMSEHTVERRMNHAYELVSNYPETHLALQDGAISVAHTEVIVAAGRVISDDLTISSVTRRSGYENAVLEHAVVETPAGLRPIARRLAEQYADVTIDERYAVACQRRRVTVTDLEDGMSDLVAHLPTVEAHAIYDRLNRASKAHADLERRVAADAAQVEAAARKAADAAGPADDRSTNAANESGADAPAGTDTSTDAGTDMFDITVSNRYAETTPRTRDQIRSDLFSELLRASGEEVLLPGTGNA